MDTTATTGKPGELLLDPVNILIRNGVADGNDGDSLATLLSEPELTTAAAGPTEIFESELEGLSGDTTVTLRASDTITVEDLADDALTFQAGLGAIRFEAGDEFVMNPGDSIIVPGRDITIAAGGAAIIGNIQTLGDGSAILPDNQDGDITITGERITAGILNALEETPITGLGDGNISQVYLESTEGDIIVDSILAGAGGVGVNAGRWFRAQGTFVMVAGPEGGVFTANTTSIVAADPDGTVTIERGTRVDLQTLQGIAIAYDVANRLPPIPIEFVIGPDTGSGIPVPSDQAGTAGAILRTRPDRTIVNAFENQTFLLDTTLTIDTTVLNNLSERTQNERAPEDSADAAEDEAAILGICDEDADRPEDDPDGDDPDDACETDPDL
ncbi:MAG: hypothetical protein F6K42_04235 [Leptolyngbya sp. SIO1D8]|nr:hypothetical protein [Leptolyngbya sp. SIO1D8]